VTQPLSPPAKGGGENKQNGREHSGEQDTGVSRERDGFGPAGVIPHGRGGRLVFLPLQGLSMKRLVSAMIWSWVSSAVA